MWFESTQLIGEYPEKLPLRSRARESRKEAVLLAVVQLREFALGEGPAPSNVVVYTNAQLVDVFGNVHRVLQDKLFTDECLLGVTRKDWETAGIELNFFGRTATTRGEFAQRSTDSRVAPQRLIWTVTWRTGRRLAVLNSHASFTNRA